MEKNIKRMSIAAMAALAVVSCSNHDEWMSYEEFKAAQYDAAFVQKYGQVDPNHTWGFGSVTTKTVTRAIEVTHKFASAPNDADFKSEKPSNAILCDGCINGSVFYIDSSINGNGNKVQPNGSTNELYVVGDVQPSDLYTPANSTIYLLPGSKLTVPSSACSFGQNNTKIYIAEGAELICGGTTFEFGYGVSVFNRGTITAGNVTISNNGLVYNQRTINTTGKIKVANNNSELVNDGTINAKDLGTEGSGHVQNNGTITITNESLINSNYNTWVNNGQYTTKYFTYQAGGNDVVNNCLLTVTEKFYINLGDTDKNGFRLDGAAGVVTKDFEGAGPFYIQMGGKSVFKVTGTATMHSTKQDYGFYGVGSDYAVLEATKIVKGGTNQGFEVTYGGKLAVVTKDHFAQGHDGDSTHPFTYIKDNAIVYAPGYNEGDVEITIPSSECNPGFTGKKTETETPDPDPVVPEQPKYEEGKAVKGRVFCEDLGSTGDFDFNDIVFDAEIKDSKIYITLYAAGGILDVTVAGVDVHEKLGEGMVNTGVKAGKVESYSFDVPANGITAIEDIPVVIKANEAAGYNKDILLKNRLGGAPQKICVPTNTKWVKEYEDISNAYPKFEEYVGNSSIGTEAFTEKNEEYLY